MLQFIVAARRETALGLVVFLFYKQVLMVSLVYRFKAYSNAAGRLLTGVLPIVGLDVGAIGSISLVGFGSGGRNSFEHQNKFFIIE